MEESILPFMGDKSLVL